jgi:hypothetical protein
MTNNQQTRMRPKRSAQAEREVRRDTPLRQARTCYGHLAGVAGIALMEELISLGWVKESTTPTSGNRVGYGLTAKGRDAMTDLGVDLAAADKTTGEFAFGCLDWTERGHHLGGSLGRAVTASLSGRGLVGRTEGTREVKLQGIPAAWFR